MFPEAAVDRIGQISLAPDWYDVIRCKGDSIWVSCSLYDKKTLHGDISVKYRNEGVALDCSTGFEAKLVKKDVIMVKNTELNLTSYFFAPYNEFSKLHKKAARSLDISPAGSLAVSSGDDDGLYVWETDTGNIRRSLEGHINSVTQCRFFPSGLVVLSGGSDMRLKIWSTEDGSCPVTLIGHTGSITGTAIIERGKNVISCARDSSVILWNVGSAECLWKLSDTSSIVNCCSVSTYQSNIDVNGSSLTNSAEECGTEGKLLVIGRENGYLEGIDLSSKQRTFSLPCYAPVNDCCFLNEHKICAGLQDGNLVLFDIRNTRTPETIQKFGKSSINCVRSFHSDSLLVGRGDGSCSCIRMSQTTPEVLTMELSGPDCDPVYNISSHENLVYTTCRDSKVRKYKLDLSG